MISFIPILAALVATGGLADSQLLQRDAQGSAVGHGLDPICNVVDSADLALPMSGPIRLPPRPPLPPKGK